MKTHTEKSTRQPHVALRMDATCTYMDEYPCESTMDYVAALGRQARGDLQRLWEDGRAIRYKCPEIAIEFGHGTVSQWFWATVEETLRWEQEDALVVLEKSDSKELT